MRHFDVKWWIVAGLTGAIIFWLFQVLTGPSTIPQFIGREIVSQGGYSEALTVPIGWGVHLGVSLSYSLLFALIMLIPFPSSGNVRVLIGLAIAALLGWVTTLLTAPAITVTVSILSRQGLPSGVPELNTTFGLPFWNHLLFFGVVWLMYALIPHLRGKV